MNSILENIYGMTAISDIVANPGFIVMYLLAFVGVMLNFVKKEKIRLKKVGFFKITYFARLLF